VKFLGHILDLLIKLTLFVQYKLLDGIDVNHGLIYLRRIPPAFRDRSLAFWAALKSDGGGDMLALCLGAHPGVETRDFKNVVAIL
jgi:hypothetical protein